MVASKQTKGETMNDRPEAWALEIATEIAKRVADKYRFAEQLVTDDVKQALIYREAFSPIVLRQYTPAQLIELHRAVSTFYAGNS